MFSIRQKREIADAVQKILRATSHPELPVGEIPFPYTLMALRVGRMQISETMGPFKIR